jgi:hypothetical protein
MGKHLRSVREDNGTLSFRHEVSSRHPVYLWVADICRWGGPRPQDATPRPALEHSTPAPSSTSGSTYSSLDPFVGYTCAI